MNNWLDKLAMSGYGSFVWSSFAIVFGVLILLYLLSRYRLKKALSKQMQFQKDKQ